MPSSNTSSKTTPPFQAPLLSQGGKVSREWYVWIQQQQAANGGTAPLPFLSPLEINDLYLTDPK